jgi:hypothetical protein
MERGLRTAGIRYYRQFKYGCCRLDLFLPETGVCIEVKTSSWRGANPNQLLIYMHLEIVRSFVLVCDKRMKGKLQRVRKYSKWNNIPFKVIGLPEYLDGKRDRSVFL